MKLRKQAVLAILSIAIKLPGLDLHTVWEDGRARSFYGPGVWVCELASPSRSGTELTAPARTVAPGDLQQLITPFLAAPPTASAALLSVPEPARGFEPHVLPAPLGPPVPPYHAGTKR